MSKGKILIIEDEESIRDVIRFALENNGFTEIKTAPDGETGIQCAKTFLPHLILLDLMLPGMDGLTVCRQLKSDEQTASIPIIMLTAKSEESDIIVGLEMGANDYITKPFSNKVLIARIRAQLRQQNEQPGTEEIHYEDLVIFPTQRQVLLNQKNVELTFTEFEILALFTRHPGRVYTRDQIISQIRGSDYPVTDRSIDVQIVNLRRKLGPWGNHIQTVRGVGYRMNPIA
ncbi:MAG: response regulator transcription factor [Verrucomicrobia bacterium]|jgi:two-component system phosphate regulon response regulator PhoB|nr:response regulator transcription factor [Verrucomicrobiota bacterium]